MVFSTTLCYREYYTLTNTFHSALLCSQNINPLPFYFECIAVPPPDDTKSEKKYGIPDCAFMVSGKNIYGGERRRLQKTTRRRILDMVQPVIVQLNPILLPKLNGEVAMSVQSDWKQKNVAELDGGFAFAQTYSNKLFLLPDVDNTYQMTWNREEDAWMVQETSKTCDENEDESNMTKMCIETCGATTVQKISRPRDPAQAVSNVGGMLLRRKKAGDLGKGKKKHKKMLLSGLNSAFKNRKNPKKKDRRRRLLGLRNAAAKKNGRLTGKKAECYAQSISDNNKGGKGDTECPTKCCLRDGDATNTFGKNRKNTCLKANELELEKKAKLSDDGEPLFGSLEKGDPCRCHAEVRRRGGEKLKVF